MVDINNKLAITPLQNIRKEISGWMERELKIGLGVLLL